MPTEFPFVTVPSEVLPVIGERDGETRIYRKKGPQDDAAIWHQAVFKIAGPSVSPGGVLMYCPVSRAAVYKRMKDGNLTAFNYYPSNKRTSFFGGLITVREMPYCYIPVSEAVAWRKELEERALSQGRITMAQLEAARKKGEWAYKILEHARMSVVELQGDKPDTEADFLSWNSRWSRQQKSKAKK